jgi:hypothetical protein
MQARGLSWESPKNFNLYLIRRDLKEIKRKRTNGIWSSIFNVSVCESDWRGQSRESSCCAASSWREFAELNEL